MLLNIFFGCFWLQLEAKQVKAGKIMERKHCSCLYSGHRSVVGKRGELDPF